MNLFQCFHLLTERWGRARAPAIHLCPAAPTVLIPKEAAAPLSDYHQGGKYPP